MSIGVWNPIDYPNPGIHSIWIDCANPLLFVNEKIDFKQIEYEIIGGTFERGDKINQINLVPFESDVRIVMKYKETYSRTLIFKALKLSKPRFELTKSNGDTLLNSIKLSQITNSRVIPSTDLLLSRDLISLPLTKIKKYEYSLTRKDEQGKTVLVFMTQSTKQLDILKKKAKKNDTMTVEVTFSTSRYSFISRKKITEESTFLRNYKIE
jgi:hypothetical protein